MPVALVRRMQRELGFEHVLTAYGLTEAAVVGVPEERLGEVGKAYVVREPGLLSEQDVIDHCREHLANFKVPRRLEFVPELPRNASGKVLKRLLGTGKAR